MAKRLTTVTPVVLTFNRLSLKQSRNTKCSPYLSRRSKKGQGRGRFSLNALQGSQDTVSQRAPYWESETWVQIPILPDASRCVTFELLSFDTLKRNNFHQDNLEAL